MLPPVLFYVVVAALGHHDGPLGVVGPDDHAELLGVVLDSLVVGLKRIAQAELEAAATGQRTSTITNYKSYLMQSLFESITIH